MKDEILSRTFGQTRRVTAEDKVFEKVWLKLEGRLISRKKPFRAPVLWKPWAHPGGWLAVAACLCVALGGFQYQRIQADKNDLASCLITIADPSADVTHDLGELKAPVLLSEPSTSITDIFFTDEDQPDPPTLL
jgi:hypothetical protein